MHHVREIELRAHHLVHEAAGFTERLPILGHHLIKLLRRAMLHVLERSLGGQDARALHELVAERVVTIAVRIEECADLVGLWHSLAHAIEHLARELEVEQRVDKQRVIAVDDQAGVAVAPASVGLEPRVAAVAEIVQTLGEFPLAHVSLPQLALLFQPNAVSPTCAPKRSVMCITQEETSSSARFQADV